MNRHLNCKCSMEYAYATNERLILLNEREALALAKEIGAALYRTVLEALEEDGTSPANRRFFLELCPIVTVTEYDPCLN